MLIQTRRHSTREFSLGLRAHATLLYSTGQHNFKSKCEETTRESNLEPERSIQATIRPHFTTRGSTVSPANLLSVTLPESKLLQSIFAIMAVGRHSPMCQHSDQMLSKQETHPSTGVASNYQSAALKKSNEAGGGAPHYLQI